MLSFNNLLLVVAVWHVNGCSFLTLPYSNPHRFESPQWVSCHCILQSSGCRMHQDHCILSGAQERKHDNFLFFFVALLKNASCLLLKICGELCFSSARHLRILANKGLAWELIDWSSICKSCCPRSPALKICIRLHVRWQGRTDQTSLCLSRADSWMDETWRNNVSHVTSEAWVL